MKRIISLSTSNAKTSIPGSESIDVDNIKTLVNCSIDCIYAYIFEYISPDNFHNLFTETLQKLRPEGELVIKFVDYRNTCYLYYKEEISDTDLNNLLKFKSNIISLDTILSMVPDKYSVSKIDYLDNFITLSILRTSV